MYNCLSLHHHYQYIAAYHLHYTPFQLILGFLHSPLPASSTLHLASGRPKFIILCLSLTFAFLDKCLKYTDYIIIKYQLTNFSFCMDEEVSAGKLFYVDCLSYTYIYLLTVQYICTVYLWRSKIFICCVNLTFVNVTQCLN